MRITLSLVCLFLTVGWSGLAHAQLNLLDTQSSLNFSPMTPEPGQTVEVTLNDYAIATDAASIAWYQNGVLQTDFNNQRVYTYIAGKAGETDEIAARLTQPNGQVTTIDGVVTPVYIDIIIEADTYTPQFFKGRALPSNGASVKATVLVSTDEMIDPSRLTYRWTLDNTVIQGGSLRGGNSVLFEVPIRLGHRLRVEISDLNGNFVGSKNLTLPIVSPQLEFYERSTLYGLRQQTLGTEVGFIGNALTLEAVPYYLDTETLLKPNTVVEWDLNYSPLMTSATTPLVMTFDRGQGEGSSNLELLIQDRTQYLQRVKGDIRIRN